MDDSELDQLRADLRGLLDRIEYLNAEAADLSREIAGEEERRKDHRPGTVHRFRPRPGGTHRKPKDDA